MDCDRQKCTRCKVNLTLDKFKKKRDDTYQKMCNECLEKGRKYKEKNKCPHDKRKSRCVECGGSEICEHGKERSKCVECKGSYICEHNRQINQCKYCCKDPVHLTIKNMINHSKQKDKKNNRYDPVNFIDYCFVENLLDDYTHCMYEDCGVKLQIMDYKDDLATIERIDNSIGHIKSNCKICCMKCNKMKKSDKQ